MSLDIIVQLPLFLFEGRESEWNSLIFVVYVFG